jgi:hypothetical protein
VRVVTIIDLLPIAIIDGSRGLHTAEVPVASSLYSELSFRSLLSLGGGTGNAPLISIRPSLITEHHLVPSLNDLAPKLAPRSAQLGLGMANGQPRALGSECWFRCAPSAEKGAVAGAWSRDSLAMCDAILCHRRQGRHHPRSGQPSSLDHSGAIAVE